MSEESVSGASKPSGRPHRRRRPGSIPRISVRRGTSGGHWVFVHPPCVRARAEDIEEVQAMMDSGEFEIARDELLWLIESCHDFIEAHQLLGRLALEIDRDIELAQAHFGCGYALGIQALRRAGTPSPLPSKEPANRPFFEAGRGLAHCLHRLGQTKKAREICDFLMDRDPENLTLASWVW